MTGRTQLGVGAETVADGDPATGETLPGDAVPTGDGVAPPVPTSDGAAPPAPEGGLAPGALIGRFVLLGSLGAGGMGQVYAAYDPTLDRKVAIKLLRAAALRGGDTDAHARLLREAQAMAKINHPNVVKVHEVGTYDEQVYVAMEFVDAGTLRAWLTRRHTLREILDVFVQAGRGLAAAHAAGLVHRDFKPDNVLLGSDGTVRVTDFGIVGVTSPLAAAPASTELPAASLDLARSGITPLSQQLTRTGAIMGTPMYMAPEQFIGAPATEQADLFSFCVVLHEALYGARPFSGKTFHELATSVRSGQVPPAPRGAPVPGWLRRVVLRGLSPDPASRPASMDALLAELVRDRARRRQLLAWTAGAGVVAISAATAAVLALRPAADTGCDAGAARAAAAWSPVRRAQLTAAFLASGRPHAAASLARLTPLLDEWTGDWSRGYRDACEATQVRREQSDRLLDLRMQCLARRLDEAGATIALLAAGGGDAVDHAIEAALALPALAPCADAAALTAAVAPPETELARAQVAAVRGQLAEARGLDQVGRYAGALAAARGALAVARATGYRPVIAEALLAVGQAQVELVEPGGVDALRESMHAATAAGDAAGMISAAAQLVYAIATQGGRPEAAREIAALAEATALHTPPPPELAARLQLSIGVLDEARGRPADARARYERALAVAERELGPDHRETLAALTQLGNLAKTEGRFADARALLDRVVRARATAFGADHPVMAKALANLGAVVQSEGKLDDAQRLFERALAINVAALGPAHPEVGTMDNHLGLVSLDRAEPRAAEGYFIKALALWERAYGPDNIQIATAATNLGTSLQQRGEYAQAARQFERVIALYEHVHGPEHPGLAGPLMNLGVTRQNEGKLDEAIALFQRVARVTEHAYGPDHLTIADALANIATVLRSQHKLDDARSMTARSLRTVEQVYGPDHARVAMGLANLGNLQAEQQDHAGALESHRRSAAIFEAKLGKDHLYLSYALLGMANALTELHRAAESLPLFERALAIRTAAGALPALLAEPHAGLAYALIELPRSRARALAEARAALALYQQAGDAANVGEMKQWLATHR